MVGCACAGINLCKLAQHALAADHFQRQEHVLMAASMLSAIVSSTLPHPTRSVGFVEYTVKELWPGYDLFSDPERVPVGSLVSSLRFVASELMCSGSSTQTLRALPLLARRLTHSRTRFTRFTLLLIVFIGETPCTH